DVALTDSIPAGATFASFGPTDDWDSSSSGVNGPITASAASLAPGASLTLQYTLNISASAVDGSTLTNTATVTTTTEESTTENNSDSVSSTVDTSADRSIVKTGPETITAGTDVTYTVVFTNNGPSDAQNVLGVDPTPPGLTFVSQTQISGPV